MTLICHSRVSLWSSVLSVGVGELRGFSSLIVVVLAPVPSAANHAREPQGLHILPGAGARDEPIAPALPCSAEVANVHRANTIRTLTKLKQHGIGSQHAATSSFLLQRAFSQVSALLLSVSVFTSALVYLSISDMTRRTFSRFPFHIFRSVIGNDYDLR